jgi:hypothetical protein
MKKILTIILILNLFSQVALAHPGNKAADGCHYCRTNCDKYGVAWNQRHCHGGSTSSTSNLSSKQPATTTTPTPIPPSLPTVPTCPTNSSYNESAKECTCKEGYNISPNNQYCIEIPENAHAVTNSTTDAWLCNEGYEEIDNSCIPIIIEKSEPKKEDINKNIETSVLHAASEEKGEDKLSINNSANSPNLIWSIIFNIFYLKLFVPL